MAENERQDETHDDDEEGAVYRVDTVPPPPGEDDAYSAPTRIGPMAEVAVQELMRQAEQSAVQDEPSKPLPTPRVSYPPPPSQRVEVLPSSDLVDETPPRIYDDDDDDDDGDAATMLHPSAKPPPVSANASDAAIQLPPAQPAKRVDRWRLVAFALAVALFVFAVVVALSR